MRFVAAHRTRLTASSDALSRLHFPANPANPVSASLIPEDFFIEGIEIP
jgi:hypothetical protein